MHTIAELCNLSHIFATRSGVMKPNDQRGYGITMYIYHALINALSAHIIHINLNMIFYTHVEHSPTKTIYIKYYTKKVNIVLNVKNNK